MALAKISAFRSKDPNTQVGACIVNEDKRVVSLGYNGMPKGNDLDFPWGREGRYHKDQKYAYVIHAELNAILNATTKLKEVKLYTTLFPCSNCAKTIAQTGITEVIYEADIYKDSDDNLIAKTILCQSGISFRKLKEFTISFD